MVKNNITNVILLYIGSILIILWGIGHLMPTRKIVEDFGSISNDSKLIITQTWVSEGITLIFIGIFALVITIIEDFISVASIAVYFLCGIILIIMAIWHVFTGSKTPILPMKICPIILTIVAILFMLGSVL